MANTALTPVTFHGASLFTTIINSVPFVVLRQIVEALGLDWKAQYSRIKRHPVLSTCVVVTTTQIPGDDQSREVVMLPLDKLNGWLFGVQVGRVKPELRARLTQYQAECFDVLARHFGAAPVVPDDANALPHFTPGVKPCIGMDAPGIDVRTLLLGGQCASQTCAPELEAAIDRQAWSMVHEAYELSREHLRRRAAYRHVTGLERSMNTKAAIADIRTVTLGEALANTTHAELRYALAGIRIVLHSAQDAKARVEAQMAELTQAHRATQAQRQGPAA
ncbi:MAG: phage antirepressor N-terminal domain-containing protein [Rhodoferax sp.]|nr:phage antirepressor N-terminal domain-containing protein [Rhodoferax sp.]